jgi:hypothetical protein
MPVTTRSQRATKTPEPSEIPLSLPYSDSEAYQSADKATMSEPRGRIPIAAKIEDVKLLQFNIPKLIRTNIRTWNSNY